jgi:hypothetical protein
VRLAILKKIGRGDALALLVHRPDAEAYMNIKRYIHGISRVSPEPGLEAVLSSVVMEDGVNEAYTSLALKSTGKRSGMRGGGRWRRGFGVDFSNGLGRRHIDIEERPQRRRIR